MACFINVTKVEGDVIPPATAASVVRIFGTATDCAAVRVILHCQQGSVEQVASVSAAGTWMAQFTNLAELGCPCFNLRQGSVTVDVTCVSDPTCRYTHDERIECIDACASVTGISHDAPLCVVQDPTQVAVQLAPVTTPPNQPGAFSWTFGDGSPPASGKFVTHTYTFPGQYTITVTFTPSAAGCDPSTYTYPLNVPLCPPVTPPPTTPPPTTHPPTTPPPTTQAPTPQPTPGPTPAPVTPPPGPTPGPVLPPFPVGDNEGSGCGVLRFLMAAAAIIAAIAALLVSCLPPAAYQTLLAIAAVAGSLALLGFIIWMFACPKPCGVAILLLGQITLGVGLGLLYFALCCPLFWAVGSGLVAAGIGLFVWWARRCRKGTCDILVQLLAALTGAVIPLLSYIDLIPILAVCKSPAMAAVLGGLVVAVNAGIIACASKKA